MSENTQQTETSISKQTKLLRPTLNSALKYKNKGLVQVRPGLIFDSFVAIKSILHIDNYTNSERYLTFYDEEDYERFHDEATYHRRRSSQMDSNLETIPEEENSVNATLLLDAFVRFLNVYAVYMCTAGCAILEER